MLHNDINEQFFKKLATLHNIILEISSKKNLSASSENLLNMLLDNLGAISGSIHLYSEDKLFLLSNRGKGCANDDIPISNDDVKKLISVQMPVESKDIFLYNTIFQFVENGKFSFSLLMPLVSGDYLVGAIFLGKKALGGYTKNEKLMLAMICKQVAIVVHNSFLERELLKANSQKSDLYIRSITDPLTKLYNRAHLEYRLKEDLKVSKRYGRPFSALMIEIDYFFQISEMNGSELTYHLLQGVSKTVEKAIRIDVDLPARYSVDTVVVLLPETVPQGAMVLADRIREKINNLHKIISIDNFPQISASIGVAFLEDKEENVEDILSKLKDALEQAKSAGRNRVFLCQKYVEEKEKVFSTFETTSGLNTDLIISGIEHHQDIETEDNSYKKPIQVGNAYKTVEYYQKEWEPVSGKLKNKGIKGNNESKNANETDEFSYQPMMFLDFIDEEEKEKLRQQQASKSLPENKTRDIDSNSLSVNDITSSKNQTIHAKKKNINKYDNIAMQKSQMKHGKIPNIPSQKKVIRKPPQIHSLGFIDEI